MKKKGEAQEELLEEFLKAKFPYDKIEPVKKGKKGGDLIQTVIDKQNNQTGKILHERKEVLKFDEQWIGKLLSDMSAIDATQGNVTYDYVGICYGDVNGTYLPGQLRISTFVELQQKISFFCSSSRSREQKNKSKTTCRAFQRIICSRSLKEEEEVLRDSEKSPIVTLLMSPGSRR